MSGDLADHLHSSVVVMPQWEGTSGQSRSSKRGAAHRSLSGAPRSALGSARRTPAR